MNPAEGAPSRMSIRDDGEAKMRERRGVGGDDEERVATCRSTASWRSTIVWFPMVSSALCFPPIRRASPPASWA